jgi:hypothetical protein
MDAGETRYIAEFTGKTTACEDGAFVRNLTHFIPRSAAKTMETVRRYLEHNGCLVQSIEAVYRVTKSQ